MRHLTWYLILLSLAACGGGGGAGAPGPAGQQLQGSCEGGVDVVMETDEQAYLQLGGAFDQLRHDEGEGEDPIKMTTKIDHWIRTYMCQNRVPGLALGVIWQGNIVYVKGYGLARGWESPLESDQVAVRGQRTRFRWASISKAVTGLASVIASRELGPNDEPIYDLDAPLQGNYRCTQEFCAYSLPDSWYPDWMEDMEEEDWPIPSETIPDVEDTYDITPRRLLAHRCGVMHYREGSPEGSNGTPSEQQKMDNTGFIWALNEWTAEPLVRLPGTTYNYSSFGANMAGAALHMAAPGGYWDYVKSRIADMAQPVPMEFFHPDDIYDPQYAADPWQTDQYRAHGYRKNDEADVVVNTTPHDVSWKLPGGGFISTCADLVLFANGLLHNHFLDAEGSDQLWLPQAFAVNGMPGGPTSGYALGFSVGERYGERVVAHSGSQEDAKTYMRIYPDGEDPSVGQLGIVVMSNAEYCDPTAVVAQVDSFLRNPYTTKSDIVFAGTLPRDLQWAQEDVVARVAELGGPFVDDGVYLDPNLDYLSEEYPAAFVVRSHRFNPTYERTPPQDSPDRVPDRDDSERREPSKEDPKDR